MITTAAVPSRMVVEIADENGVTFAHYLIYVRCPATADRTFDVSYSWPVYVREGYTVRKDCWDGPITDSMVTMTGWQGPIPDGRYINTNH